MRGGHLLIRKVGCLSLPFAALVSALPLIGAPGCSGDPAVGVSANDEPFTKEELAEMRKAARSPSAFRDMKRKKLAEREGAVVIKTQPAARKSKPR
jgi:hypothetical protein